MEDYIEYYVRKGTQLTMPTKGEIRMAGASVRSNELPPDVLAKKIKLGFLVLAKEGSELDKLMNEYGNLYKDVYNGKIPTLDGRWKASRYQKEIDLLKSMIAKREAEKK